MSDKRVPDELELHASPEKKPETAGEFILTPSPAKEKPESAELILEADGIYKAEEITFDGEEEAEARIEEAMKAYDAAMDDAAGANSRK